MTVYRFLASRRWLVRTLAGILLVLLCVRLGLWQLDRSEERSEGNSVIEANIDDEPVSIDEVVSPGDPLRDGDQWRTVEIRGRYDAEHEMVLRLRPVDGVPGVHALTPLVTPEDDAVLVDRGFLRSRGRPDDTIEPPAPPPGQVTVRARVRTSETGRGTGGDPADGAIRYVDLAALDDALPYPLYGAWVELIEQDPPASSELQPITPPETEPGPHLSYAVQWFLFAVVGVGGFVLLVRAEARGRDDADRPGEPGESGHEGADTSPPRHDIRREQVDR